MMRAFIRDISLPYGRWRKQYLNIWFGLAMLTGIYISVTQVMDGSVSWWRSLIYLLTFMTGCLCVTSLADRSPVAGNALGVASNVGEVFTQFSYGNFGMASAGIYYGMTHILGFFTWTNKENQKDGKVTVSPLSKMGVVLTGFFMIAGIFLMMRYSSLFEIANTHDLVFYMNILAFVIGIIAQFTMIMRKPVSWIFWVLSNFIWFYLNMSSGNYLFAFQSVLYQINAFLAIYSWYDEAKKSR